MREVIAVLRGLRASAVISEYDLACAIERVLCENGFSFVREAVLALGCRADFLLDGGLVIEVKSQNFDRRRVKAQLARYAACPPVNEILLVSNAAVSLPEKICGKPVFALDIRRLWGIAL